MAVRGMYEAYGKGAIAGSVGNITGAITSAVLAAQQTHPVASVVLGVAAGTVAALGAVATQYRGLHRRNPRTFTPAPENKVRHGAYSAYQTALAQRGLAAWAGAVTAVGSVQLGAHPAWSAVAGIMTAAAGAAAGKLSYLRDLRGSLTEKVADTPRRLETGRVQMPRGGRDDPHRADPGRSGPGRPQAR